MILTQMGSVQKAKIWIFKKVFCSKSSFRASHPFSFRPLFWSLQSFYLFHLSSNMHTNAHRLTKHTHALTCTLTLMHTHTHMSKLTDSCSNTPTQQYFLSLSYSLSLSLSLSLFMFLLQVTSFLDDNSDQNFIIWWLVGNKVRFLQEILSSWIFKFRKF